MSSRVLWAANKVPSSWRVKPTVWKIGSRVDNPCGITWHVYHHLVRAELDCLSGRRSSVAVGRFKLWEVTHKLPCNPIKTDGEKKQAGGQGGNVITLEGEEAGLSRDRRQC